MNPAAYGAGARAADAEFGIRTAMDVGRMPDGPAHIGASRFSAALSQVEGHAPTRRPQSKENRLERPTLWSNPASTESGGVSNNDTGLSYGGV